MTSHRPARNGLRGRRTLAAILVAGWLIAPAAAAPAADHGPGAANGAAGANVYVPPPGDTATTTAKRTIPALPDVVARYTGRISAADCAYQQAVARSSLPPAGNRASAPAAIVLALMSALASGFGVLLVQRARRARRLGT